MFRVTHFLRNQGCCLTCVSCGSNVDDVRRKTVARVAPSFERRGRREHSSASAATKSYDPRNHTKYHELYSCWFDFVLIRVISWIVLLSKLCLKTTSWVLATKRRRRKEFHEQRRNSSTAFFNLPTPVVSSAVPAPLPRVSFRISLILSQPHKN